MCSLSIRVLYLYHLTKHIHVYVYYIMHYTNYALFYHNYCQCMCSECFHGNCYHLVVLCSVMVCVYVCVCVCVCVCAVCSVSVLISSLCMLRSQDVVVGVLTNTVTSTHQLHCFHSVVHGCVNMHVLIRKCLNSILMDLVHVQTYIMYM